MAHLFPFTAIVGQPRLRLALVLTAIEPRIGGVLIRGEKGTAKSTVVRSLAASLPSGRMRTLSLGATEDRLVGGLDLEATLASGRPQLQPGILAESHGGVVYVDEVNLLEDHLVNLVLDAASSGVVQAEREGISIAQPAEFSLVGTMNPEEGDLGPGLLDRFGLCVEVTAELGIEERTEILARRLQYDAAPALFADSWAGSEAKLAERLASARAEVGRVSVTRDVSDAIARECVSANVSGHRGDLAMTAAARAHAAWHGRPEVTDSDVAAVVEFALVHRRRAAPPEAPPPPAAPEQERQEPPEPVSEGESRTPDEPAPDQVVEPGEIFRVREIVELADEPSRTGSGRRRLTLSTDKRGHRIGARATGDPSDLALDATLRAAAPHQLVRRARANGQGDGRAELAILVDRDDWRRKVRARRSGSYVVFVVDASGSMGARNRMVASKGAILSLLLDTYVKRDKVALISFRRESAETLVPPTSSIELAQRRLRELPIGGRTPLASGLHQAGRLVAPLLRKDPGCRPLVIVVTDGRGNVDLDGNTSRGATAEATEVARRLAEDRRISWVVVDTEPPGVRSRGRGPELAEALGASLFTVEDLRADDLIRLVQTARQTLKESS